MTLAGDSADQIIADMKTAFDKKELPVLEPGAMSYMLAKGSYLTDDGDHNGPHLMFFVTRLPIQPTPGLDYSADS